MPKVQATNGMSAGRGGRGRRVTTSLAEINVVPLVDVMLVLLIIFMITAPMIQRGVEVKLPQSTGAKPIPGERIDVTVQKGQRVHLNNESVRLDVLEERIRQLMENRDKKEVFLRGEGDILYQELMDVFDRLKSAGVQTVGMETDLPRRR